VGSEGRISFSQQLHSTTISLQRNGSKQVNGNGIAKKNFNNYTELKYETNTTAMANIGYKINSNNKKVSTLYITPQLNPKKSIQDTL
jgi:hypothetical protein